MLTLPGTIFRISFPKSTNNLSIASDKISDLDSLTDFSFAYLIAWSIKWSYFSFFVAAKISEGFVVESVGLNTSIAKIK